MDQSNLPVTSREYKLMLNVDRFKIRSEGSDAMWSLVEFLILKQGGDADADVEEKIRRTWYLDTLVCLAINTARN
jgi:hypothetical protein